MGGDPSYILTPPEGKFLSVSTGNYHACGVREDSTLACWGRTDEGQSYPPEGEFSWVSASYWHTCRVRTYGAIECWGKGLIQLEIPS